MSEGTGDPPSVLSVWRGGGVPMSAALATEYVSRRTDARGALIGVSSSEGGTGVPISASLSCIV